MKATLTAIHKEHLDNILSGTKEIEWRTKPLPLGIHYAYETKKGGGTGMVNATFEVIRHYIFTDIADIPEYMIRQGCVSRKWLRKYARGRALFANIIFSPERLPEPKKYSDFYKYKTPRGIQREGYNLCLHNKQKVNTPPQSFVYIDI